RLVAHAAEELFQAMVEQLPPLARSELGIVEVVDVDVQQALAERPKRAGRVVLELVGREGGVSPEREGRPRVLQRRSRQLAGEPSRRNLADECPDALPLRGSRPGDAAKAGHE